MNSTNKDENILDRVNLRETLLRTLHDQVQEITEKFITLSIYKELPDLSLGAGNDQELVDRTLITLSHLLQLCIIGTCNEAA